MTTVYLDPVGTAVPETVDQSPAGGSLLPGALEAVARLCDARYEVVVVASSPPPGFDRLHAAVSYDPHPLDGRTTGARPAPYDVDRPWFIASDRGWREMERPQGIRSIRVGPKPAAGRRTAARFDLEARDLPAAVMEILIRDTMS